MMHGGMGLAGGTALGGRRHRTRKVRRGGGYFGAGGVDTITPFGVGPVGGGRRRTLKAKTLRRMLKKKGMKTTGKKATLMKRLHLKGGGVATNAGAWDGGWDDHGAGNPDYYGGIRGS
jgi:hypothetical protein